MSHLPPHLLAGHAPERYGCPAGCNRAWRQELFTMKSHGMYPCLLIGHAGATLRRGMLSITPISPQGNDVMVTQDLFSEMTLALLLLSPPWYRWGDQPETQARI